MLNMNLQFFAHKKGVGSTKNGRDSESKRLGAKRADGQFVKAGNILIQTAWHKDSSGCKRRYAVEMIHYLLLADGVVKIREKRKRQEAGFRISSC